MVVIFNFFFDDDAAGARPRINTIYLFRPLTFITPCFIKPVYICHIRLFPYNYIIIMQPRRLSIGYNVSQGSICKYECFMVVVIIEGKVKHGVIYLDAMFAAT